MVGQSFLVKPSQVTIRFWWKGHLCQRLKVLPGGERNASKVCRLEKIGLLARRNALSGKASVVREDEIKDEQGHVFLPLDGSLFIMRWNQITAAASTVS